MQWKFWQKKSEPKQVVHIKKKYEPSTFAGLFPQETKRLRAAIKSDEPFVFVGGRIYSLDGYMSLRKIGAEAAKKMHGKRFQDQLAREAGAHVNGIL